MTGACAWNPSYRRKKGGSERRRTLDSTVIRPVIRLVRLVLGLASLPNGLITGSLAQVQLRQRVFA